MALVKCPECTKEISSSAKACPHCGHPMIEIQDVEGENIENQNEALGVLIVAVPLIAAVVAWLWVSNLRLIDNPESKLGLILAATIVCTAIMITVEAVNLGIGSAKDVAQWKAANKNSTGKMQPPPAIVWFFGCILLWIFAYPSYLFYRRRYRTKNLCGAGLFSAAALLGVLVMLYSMIGDARQGMANENRAAKEHFQKEMDRLNELERSLR